MGEQREEKCLSKMIPDRRRKFGGLETLKMRAVDAHHLVVDHAHTALTIAKIHKVKVSTCR